MVVVFCVNPVTAFHLAFCHLCGSIVNTTFKTTFLNWAVLR